MGRGWSASGRVRWRPARRNRMSDPVFQPYGICENIPDPIARALNGLLDEVTNLRAAFGRNRGQPSRTDPDSIAGVEAPEPRLGNGAIENERVS